MADVYGKRKEYQGGGFFIFIIPIGMILIFLLYDFAMGVYKETDLKNNTKEIFMQILNREGLETEEQYKEYAKRIIKENGYDPDEASFTRDEDTFYLTIYDRYTSVIGTLSFGTIRNKEIMVSSNFKGYYNEFKEAVVEEYVENFFNEDYADEDTIIN